MRHHAAYMDEDDAKLIARVAGGDLGHPLEELYDRYAGRLYGLGLRVLGDPGLAEELVQETFVRLWAVGRAVRPAARVGDELRLHDRAAAHHRPAAPPLLPALCRAGGQPGP